MAKRGRLSSCRVEATFSEPLAFLPFFLAISGWSLSAAEWERFGHGVVSQNALCACVLSLGIVGYFIRWHQHANPEQWQRFVKGCAILYLIVGGWFVFDGYRPLGVFILTMVLVCLKEINYHRIFTKSRRLSTWK